MRFSDARLQAESSRNMYSEHGLDALMRSVFGHVCQALMVVSNCMPGSPQSQAASVTWRMSSRARSVSSALPSVRAVSSQSPVLEDRPHERVRDADRVVRVLEEDRVVGAALHVEAAVVAGVDERPGLLLLVGLAGDELQRCRGDRRRGSPSSPRGASCRPT